ncbi:hypothetical protein JCM19239_4010 [Vibrio variabilis]|uniref:Uncharacterized protein n=1 Tax=Vibrio variabilis TaxID=990271 RepID=A0ABQ0J6H1_9VIBR|nr:hypothetical protein JCM19239_4010 [Vibrio variabilis]
MDGRDEAKKKVEIGSTLCKRMLTGKQTAKKQKGRRSVLFNLQK